MRPLVLVLLVALLLPTLANAGTAADPAGDERMLLAVVAYSRVDAPAATLGCRAPAVDILEASAVQVEGHVVLRVALAAAEAAPTCRGVPLDASARNVHINLYGSDWEVWTLGGSYCNGGAWDCVAIVKRGHSGFVRDAPDVEASFEGGVWTMRFPVVGATFLGPAYDLRGGTFAVAADAEQWSDHVYAGFFDEASAPDVTFA